MPKFLIIDLTEALKDGVFCGKRNFAPIRKKKMTFVIFIDILYVYPVIKGSAMKNSLIKKEREIRHFNDLYKISNKSAENGISFLSKKSTHCDNNHYIYKYHADIAFFTEAEP